MMLTRGKFHGRVLSTRVSDLAGDLLRSARISKRPALPCASMVDGRGDVEERSGFGEVCSAFEGVIAPARMC